MKGVLSLFVGALLWGAPFVLADAIPAGFNDEQIVWHNLKQGRERAKQQGKPVFVLVHATWCPVCGEYKSVFFDPEIVRLSQSFVFILIDKDAEADAASTLAPDGNYVPRSMFLAADGTVDVTLNSGRDDFLYFLAPDTPRQLRRNLKRALQRFR